MGGGGQAGGRDIFDYKRHSIRGFDFFIVYKSSQQLNHRKQVILGCIFFR